jgi:methionyl aminopeptidase
MITIKTEEEINLMRYAGRVAYEVLEMLEDMIKVGITTSYLDKIAYDYITSKSCTPSFLNYEGFPASICASINEVVVHGIPNDKRKLKNGDIISIDIGVCYKGYHADTARTYKVGHTSKEVDKLVSETKKSLYEGIKQIKNGKRLSEISIAIEKIGRRGNYAIFRELTGHGVGKDLHEDPYIPNYKTNDEDLILKSGMVLAIEPMFGLKSREIVLEEDDWAITTIDNSVSAHFEHSVLVTDDGYEILTGE